VIVSSLHRAGTRPLKVIATLPKSADDTAVGVLDRSKVCCGQCSCVCVLACVIARALQLHIAPGTSHEIVVTVSFRFVAVWRDLIELRIVDSATG
jgi:hypothetical protein